MFMFASGLHQGGSKYFFPRNYLTSWKLHFVTALEVTYSENEILMETSYCHVICWIFHNLRTQTQFFITSP